MYVHRGRTLQRGYGLVGIFRGIMRAILPAAKAVIRSPIAKSFKKSIMKGGRHLVADVVRGDNVKAATKRRLAALRDSVADDINVAPPRAKKKKRAKPRAYGKRFNLLK